MAEKPKEPGAAKVENPDWLPEDYVMTPAEQATVKAYNDVLGRDPDPSGFAEFRKYGDDYEQISALVASSAEAQREGVDATEFGAEVVSEDEIPDALKPYYDVWKEEVGGQVTKQLITQLKYYKQAGDPSFLKAEITPDAVRYVHEVDEKGRIAVGKVYTKEAIDIMGGRFTAHGVDAGDAIFLPDGTAIANKDTWQKNKSQDGFTSWGATGNLSDGLLGAVGIDPNDLPNWVAPAVDYVSANTGSAILGGSKMHQDTSKLLNKYGGKSAEKYVNLASDVTLAVAGAASGGVAWALAPAVSAARNVGYHEMGYDISLKDVAVDTAINAALSWAGSNQALVGKTGTVARTLRSPLTQVALKTGAAAATGRDIGEAATDAAFSVIAGKVGAQYGAGASVALNMTKPLWSDQEWNAAMLNAATTAATVMAGGGGSFKVPKGSPGIKAFGKDVVTDFNPIAAENWYMRSPKTSAGEPLLVDYDTATKTGVPTVVNNNGVVYRLDSGDKAGQYVWGTSKAGSNVRQFQEVSGSK
jgi:hypothetical protein